MEEKSKDHRARHHEALDSVAAVFSGKLAAYQCERCFKQFKDNWHLHRHMAPKKCVEIDRKAALAKIATMRAKIDVMYPKV
jgi:hypothetical protein